jgi:hypothetical protein
MAELVDALDLGSSTARCEGSSPFVRIELFTCFVLKADLKDCGEISLQPLRSASPSSIQEALSYKWLSSRSLELGFIN